MKTVAGVAVEDETAENASPTPFGGMTICAEEAPVELLLATDEVAADVASDTPTFPVCLLVGESGWVE